jgi:cell division protein FtsI (penicillin-binding protein 3)
MVVIDDPKGFRQYGGDVAAPVFKEIADKIYAQDLEMHRRLPSRNHNDEVFPVVKAGHAEDLQYLCDEMQVAHRARPGEEWAAASLNGKTIFWKGRVTPVNQVPDVRGMTLRDALYLLENKGLEVSWEGQGRVIEQSQSPGSSLVEGSRILLKLQ